MPPLVSVTTTRLGAHLPLLELLPDPAPIAWVRGGEGIIGWGVYATTTVTGPHRFDEARKWWHKHLETFGVANSVYGSGTGPILFASFSFDPDEDSVLVIPQTIAGLRNGKSWITWIGPGAQPELAQTPPPLDSTEFNWGDGTLNPTEWQSRVATAITEIAESALEKVVLARDLRIESHTKIDARTILRKLSAEYPSTWIFAVAGLVGATPELLIRLTRGMVTSRVLAGTISKTGDDEKDLALAGSLARSSKDREEHEYAVRSVTNALEPFCTSTNIPESPFVLHLANVMHLATDVTGVLIESKKSVDVFSLLEKLHPSAAVCGTPTNLAAQVINRLEGMSRGRYAGPVGWIDAGGDGELGIALRSGQIDQVTGKEIRIFAGCGIVAGSNPEKELQESNAKFAAMRSALH